MNSRRFNRGLLTGLLLVAIAFLSPAARAENGPANVAATNSDETLRSYLQLQEQLHTVQMSLEKNRQEAESAATRSAEALVGRLQAIEQSLSAQRARELEGLQSAGTSVWLSASPFSVERPALYRSAAPLAARNRTSCSSAD